MSQTVRTWNRYSPRVEGLESRVPLSGATGALHGGPAAAAAAPIVARQAQGAALALALAGTLRGGYAVSSVIPDVGKSYQFGVVGRISPLGQTGASGQIHTTGFIATGMAAGTMTIKAPRGAIKLQLTGPSQPGFAPLPGTMAYTISGGTGVYKNATGSGTITITPTSGLFSYGFGLMTMTFRASTGTTPST